jgi:hypothetical protein
VRNCLLFPRMLRRVGIAVGLDQVLAFTQALAWIDLSSRDQVYYSARALLICRVEHIRLFDAVFQRFWRAERVALRPRSMRRAPRQRSSERPFTIVTFMAYKARMSDPAIDVLDKAETASDQEILQGKDFSTLTTEELAQIRQLMQAMVWRISLRETRRRRPHRGGDSLHLAAVLRDAARHAGTPTRLMWRRRTLKQRPVVIIADISGSMERYARLLLHFLYSIAHALQRVECFVFGTRLTRITGQLKVRNIDQAIDQAAREVVDWAGGTRIGTSVQQFNRRWSRRVLGRGAIVLLISDGWEQGDPRLLASELRHLQQRCYRLIWLNPLLGRSGYRPEVAGMQAALASVDDFLPIHNLQSLEVLAQHLGRLNVRRTSRGLMKRKKLFGYTHAGR